MFCCSLGGPCFVVVRWLALSEQFNQLWICNYGVGATEINRLKALLPGGGDHCSSLSLFTVWRRQPHQLAEQAVVKLSSENKTSFVSCFFGDWCVIVKAVTSGRNLMWVLFSCKIHSNQVCQVCPSSPAALCVSATQTSVFNSTHVMSTCRHVLPGISLEWKWVPLLFSPGLWWCFTDKKKM